MVKVLIKDSYKNYSASLLIYRFRLNTCIILNAVFVLMLLLINPNPLHGEVLKKPHEDCLNCHKEKDSKELKSPVNELCLKCHPLSTQRDHPVNIKATVRPVKLPLDSEGRITCITCHEPHGKTGKERLLRMQFNDLCRECHKMF